ncbi:MAG: MOP flippase family protein [Bacteroidales bacterium]|jgi:O-antigen/teichoic acid export membrane protein|nr:MOP flippase family protein [Bacteroidales bacterium]
MSLKETGISGVKWNTVASVNNAVIQTVKLMLLARLLTKSELGIANLSLVVVGFTEIFANLGMNVGLIHKQDITQKQYSSVFWLNLLLSVMLFGVLCLLSPLCAVIYHEPELKTIIPVLGLLLPISAFGKMFYTFKTKELQFKFISIVSLISVEAGAVVTIVLAWWGWGAYSLVIGFLLQYFIMQSIYAIAGMKKYKILFYCKLKEIKDMLKIGGFQVGTQVMDFISSKIDQLVIGFFGMEILGVYGLVKDLIHRILNTINPIIVNVATPVFATFQKHLDLIQKRYLLLLKTILCIDFPIFMLLLLFPLPISEILFGQNMSDAAPFTRLFALMGLCISVSSPAGVLFVSLGRTDLSFIWTIIRLGMTTIALSIASQISTFAIAWAQVIIALVTVFLYWKVMIFPMSRIRFKDYMQIIARQLLYVVLSAIPCLYFAFIPLSKPLSLLFMTLYFICYILVLFIMDKKYMHEMLQLVFPKIFKNKFKISCIFANKKINDE